MALREALRREGLRGYRIDATDLRGRPDVVFSVARVLVFCDGDFWHGRNLEERLAKLERGHNAPYWVEKISGNVARDRRNNEALAADGWKVLRYWESSVKERPEEIAKEVREVVTERRKTAKSRPAARRRTTRK